MRGTSFEKNELIHAKSLFAGKLTDALQFNTRIDSFLPSDFNLPSLKNNLIEGIVIKPLSHHPYSIDGTRPIMKIKNKEFSEERRFNQAQKCSCLPKISSHTIDLAFILDEIRCYVTENRLDSAISKIGSMDYKNPQRILDIKVEILKDIFITFDERSGHLLDDLTPKQKMWIEKRIKADITEMKVRR